MKALALLLVLIFGYVNTAYAVFYMYRKNGGEVIGASVNSYNLDANGDFAEVENPTLPDGNNLVPKKIYAGGDVVRNALAGEIALFPTYEWEDERDQLRTDESARMDDDTLEYQVVKGLALVTMDEINFLRTRVNNIEACIESANNLSSAVNCLQGYPDMPTRTKGQIIPAVQGKITGGQAD